MMIFILNGVELVEMLWREPRRRELRQINRFASRRSLSAGSSRLPLPA